MSENWWDLKKKQKNKSVVRKTSIIEKKNGKERKIKTKDYLKRHWATEAQNAPKSQFLVFIGKKR